eukprot:2031230-Amphidinium_carterae.1
MELGDDRIGNRICIPSCSATQVLLTGWVWESIGGDRLTSNRACSMTVQVCSRCLSGGKARVRSRNTGATSIYFSKWKQRSSIMKHEDATPVISSDL